MKWFLYGQNQTTSAFQGAGANGGTMSTSTVQQIDLYREVHKGLRKALFDVTVKTGNTDYADQQAVQDLTETIRGATALLFAHAEHEDGPIQPHIATHVPELADAIIVAHRDCEERLAKLELLIDQLTVADDDERSKIGKVLYLDLADFVACYLSHMAVEERQVMPVLAAALTFDELLATQIAVRSSIPPPQMVASLTFMLPAMNIDERTTMLGQMHTNVPADAFANFWSIANDVLEPADVQAVACRIGLG
jgi:hypothetical protein